MEGNQLTTTKSCYKCNGTGHIREYHYIQGGICFSCWGSGSHTFESSYPQLNSTLKNIVKNDEYSSIQEMLLEQIKEIAIDFYRYESELLKAKAEQDEEGMYYYDTKMNELITQLFSLTKKINPNDKDIKYRIEKEIRQY